MPILIFDCDSTLSAIEGIDELAKLRGPDIGEQVEALTTEAMNGTLPIDEIFGRRMELIRPSAQECADIGQQYIERLVPGASESIEHFQTRQSRDWTLIILSGGFRPVIAPLARTLGIDRVEAVDIHFDPNGAYLDFDRDYPSTRNEGKSEIIHQIRSQYPEQPIAMVGDGISDLETKPHVERFIGYGGVVERPAVVEGADHYTHHLGELPDLLADWD